MEQLGDHSFDPELRESQRRAAREQAREAAAAARQSSVQADDKTPSITGAEVVGVDVAQAASIDRPPVDQTTETGV